MDRESPLWTRRSNANKPPLSSHNSEQRDGKSNNPVRSFSSSKRFAGVDQATPGRPSAFNNVPPLNTSTVASPTASSAFGLGSGAFASFGSAAKTPKTPGTAFDFSKAPVIAASPTVETDRQLRFSAKPSSSSTPNVPKDSGAISTESKPSWPLKYTWVIWYRPPTSKNLDYEKSIRPLYRMTTAQEFWRIYAHMKRPSALPVVSDYHLFKDGIRPVWEDEENKRGGKWIMRLKKGVMDRYWDDMLLAVVGDQFVEAGEEVCGMVVSVRGGEDVLSVWTKIDGGRNIKIRETIKRVLNLPADTVIVWKSHDDSIAQRSAIDQARQDKAPSDKRRVNAENVAPSKERATPV